MSSRLAKKAKQYGRILHANSLRDRNKPVTTSECAYHVERQQDRVKPDKRVPRLKVAHDSTMHAPHKVSRVVNPESSNLYVWNSPEGGMKKEKDRAVYSRQDFPLSKVKPEPRKKPRPMVSDTNHNAAIDRQNRSSAKDSLRMAGRSDWKAFKEAMGL